MGQWPFLLSTICSCTETFCEVKLKGDVLINLAEEISGWHSIQAMARILLAAFSYVYCDNQEQKTEQKDLKTLECSHKSLSKTGAKEVVVVKNVIVF